MCDDVKTYDEIGALDASSPAAFVDMAGNAEVITGIHRHFGANLKLSTGVGATHWEAPRFRGEGAVVPHNFFFAPGQLMKREQEWGPGEVMRRGALEAARMSMELRSVLKIQREPGAANVAEAFARLVRNETPANVGIIGSIPA
jgi:hypothetical protein